MNNLTRIVVVRHEAEDLFRHLAQNQAFFMLARDEHDGENQTIDLVQRPTRSLVKALLGWLKAASHRKVTFTTQSGETINAEGLSPSDFEYYLNASLSISATGVPEGLARQNATTLHSSSAP